jgi:hypothetical protein
MFQGSCEDGEAEDVAIEADDARERFVATRRWCTFIEGMGRSPVTLESAPRVFPARLRFPSRLRATHQRLRRMKLREGFS